LNRLTAYHTIYIDTASLSQGITSDVGVTRYDRIVSTINFFHLFRAKGEMIEQVKIETSVDEDKMSSQTLDPVDIRRSGHTVQSPKCILKQDKSTVSIRIVAYYKTMDNVIYVSYRLLYSEVLCG
jgi:regulator of protease activity HflC (stomatin/prohibitin superfamily)